MTYPPRVNNDESSSDQSDALSGTVEIMETICCVGNPSMVDIVGSSLLEIGK